MFVTMSRVQKLIADDLQASRTRTTLICTVVRFSRWWPTGDCRGSPTLPPWTQSFPSEKSRCVLHKIRIQIQILEELNIVCVTFSLRRTRLMTATAVTWACVGSSRTESVTHQTSSFLASSWLLPWTLPTLTDLMDRSTLATSDRWPIG